VPAVADDRHERVRALFEAALDIAESERAAFVHARCSNAPALAEEVLRLLERDREEDGDAAAWASDAMLALIGQAVPGSVVEGREVGAYRIEALIGAGGMGRVYRAVRCDGQVEQRVALKLIRQEALNPALLRRFSAERRVLASLDHPGICRFIDAGTLPEGSPYVLMELVEGEPILDYCNRLGLDIEARLRLFRKVLAAVEHAHRNLVIHRDIKSGNVLVTAGGEPKLLDFGIAKALDDGVLERTATADRFLTPSHAAPEQLSGAPVGTACDIYALGLLLYELLAGAPAFAFEGLGVGEVVQRILHEPPAAPSRRAAGVSAAIARARGQPNAEALARRLKGDLDVIVQISLRKAPGERYAGAGDFDAEIARHLDGYPVRARHGERWYRARKFVRRHRTAMVLGALLAVTMVGALVAIVTQAVALADERNRAVAERDRAQHAVAVLRDAFAGADPARVGGAHVTAAQVLDSARERIEPLVDAQPELFAELAATIAEVEQELGRHTQARALASMALQAIDASRLPASVRRGLLLVLARAATGIGDREEAEAVLAEVRALDQEEQADWLIALGRLRQNTEPEQAIDLLSRALDRLETVPPTEPLPTLARWHLAFAHRSAGNPETGLQVLDATLRWQREHLDAGHPRLVLTGLWRAEMLRALGRSEAAVEEASERAAEVVARYGSGSAMALRARHFLATALRSAGRDAEAAAEYRPLIVDLIHTLGPTHRDTWRAQANLANLLAETSDGAGEAEALLRTVLAAHAGRAGEGSDIAAFFRIRLADLLMAQQRWVQVLEVLAPAGESVDPQAWAFGRKDAYRASLLAAIEALDCATGSDEPRPECQHAVALATALASESPPR
jgi:eukaryotic-like serine/threonine-protein kinase